MKLWNTFKQAMTEDFLRTLPIIVFLFLIILLFVVFHLIAHNPVEVWLNETFHFRTWDIFFIYMFYKLFKKKNIKGE